MHNYRLETISSRPQEQNSRNTKHIYRNSKETKHLWIETSCHQCLLRPLFVVLGKPWASTGHHAVGRALCRCDSSMNAAWLDADAAHAPECTHVHTFKDIKDSNMSDTCFPYGLATHSGTMEELKDSLWSSMIRVKRLEMQQPAGCFRLVIHDKNSWWNMNMNDMIWHDLSETGDPFKQPLPQRKRNGQLMAPECRPVKRI